MNKVAHGFKTAAQDSNQFAAHMHKAVKELFPGYMLSVNKVYLSLLIKCISKIGSMLYVVIERGGILSEIKKN